MSNLFFSNLPVYFCSVTKLLRPSEEHVSCSDVTIALVLIV